MINYLLKNHATNTVSAVDRGFKGAKKAVMDYEIIDEAEDSVSQKLTYTPEDPTKFAFNYQHLDTLYMVINVMDLK